MNLLSTASEVIQVSPSGIRKSLSWLKNRYGDIDTIITANGLPDQSDAEINGSYLQQFRSNYINEALKGNIMQ